MGAQVQEVGEMDRRSRLPRAPRLTGFVHIAEPELDMRRECRPQPGAFARLLEALRKLISDRGTAVSPPMRSIGRELEESWPTGES